MYHTWTHFFGPLSTDFHQDVLYEFLDFQGIVFFGGAVYLFKAVGTNFIFYKLCTHALFPIQPIPGLLPPWGSTRRFHGGRGQ